MRIVYFFFFAHPPTATKERNQNIEYTSHLRVSLLVKHHWCKFPLWSTHNTPTPVAYWNQPHAHLFWTIKKKRKEGMTEEKRAALPEHHQDDFKQNVCFCKAVESLSGGMQQTRGRLASVVLILLPRLFVCHGGVPVSTKHRLQLFKVQQHRAWVRWGRAERRKTATLHHSKTVEEEIRESLGMEKDSRIFTSS